jgi:hypothetical protein
MNSVGADAEGKITVSIVDKNNVVSTKTSG